MKYAGRLLPSNKWYARDDNGKQRLPHSMRVADDEGKAAAGHRTLHHSTHVEIRRTCVANQTQGEIMRRYNRMFTQIAANELPQAKRKGRGGKDYTADPLYRALKDMPTNPDAWHIADGEFSEDNARKLQSKIAAFAKAGAGTFSTSYRGNRVYVCKKADTYTAQRGV